MFGSSPGGGDSASRRVTLAMYVRHKLGTSEGHAERRWPHHGRGRGAAGPQRTRAGTGGDNDRDVAAPGRSRVRQEPKGATLQRLDGPEMPVIQRQQIEAPVALRQHDQRGVCQPQSEIAVLLVNVEAATEGSRIEMRVIETRASEVGEHSPCGRPPILAA